MININDMDGDGLRVPKGRVDRTPAIQIIDMRQLGVIFLKIRNVPWGMVTVRKNMDLRSAGKHFVISFIPDDEYYVNNTPTIRNNNYAVLTYNYSKYSYS